MQTLLGGDIMALKNMVNELVELGFENTTQVLDFAGFTKRTPEHEDDLERAEDFIRGYLLMRTSRMNYLIRHLLSKKM